MISREGDSNNSKRGKRLNLQEHFDPCWFVTSFAGASFGQAVYGTVTSVFNHFQYLPDTLLVRSIDSETNFVVFCCSLLSHGASCVFCPYPSVCNRVLFSNLSLTFSSINQSTSWITMHVATQRNKMETHGHNGWIQIHPVASHRKQHIWIRPEATNSRQRAGKIQLILIFQNLESSPDDSYWIYLWHAHRYHVGRSHKMCPWLQHV